MALKIMMTIAVIITAVKVVKSADKGTLLDTITDLFVLVTFYIIGRSIF